MVAYNEYTASAKEKVTESNFNNINKALVLEFMNCELDSSKLIFNNHSCSNSNAPSANLIGNYITGTLKIKNPYGSSLINSNPCNQGTVSISIPSIVYDIVRKYDIRSIVLMLAITLYKLFLSSVNSC